jgi:Peptidase family M23
LRVDREKGREQTSDSEQSPPERLIRLKHFIIILIICIIVPIAAAGWTDLYKNYLEHTPPKITLIDVPRGIGSAPVSLRIAVHDSEAGLDEVVIRLRQRGPVRELKRVQLKGKTTEEISLDFNGENSGLDEGLASIEIKAFDRAFWNNGSELSVPLSIDYRRPRLEVLSTQHNARRGGSQLIFYKAFDENLAISGVKVDSKTFLGFPASSLDKDIIDKNIYVAIYAIPIEFSGSEESIKLFAEDTVGNGISMPFYNKVAERNIRETRIKITEDFLRGKVIELAESGRLRVAGGVVSDSLSRGGDAALLNNFKFVNEKLRSLNENEIVSWVVKSPRNESFFDGPFMKIMGGYQYSFADNLIFSFNGQDIGRTISLGEEIVLPRDYNEALVVNDGIVIFSQNLGVYGWVIGVDHGLGISTIYYYLKNVSVKQGEAVSRGQVIGAIGGTGFTRSNLLGYGVRVQGVPVDPREWWEVGWYQAHVVSKVNDLKRALGIPVYIPVR